LTTHSSHLATLPDMSVKKTVTFKISDANKAIQLDRAGCLILALQKSKKSYTCTYLDMSFKAGDTTSNGLWVKVGGIKDAVNSGGFVIAANVLDIEKAKEKFTDDPENQRMRIATTSSKAGDIGTFSVALSPIFKEKVEALAATGVINIKNRVINPFAQTHISDDSKNIELRGKPIEDPIIRFIIDLSAPKEWYRKGFAWGKTVTQFLDFTKPIVDDDGVTRYEELKWKNDQGVEESISSANIHHVITAGSIVHDCTIWYGNPSISKSFVSSRATMTRCVIECIDNSVEVTAEPNFGDSSAATIVTAAEVNAAVTPQATAETVTAASHTASQADIDGFINDLC